MCSYLAIAKAWFNDQAYHAIAVALNAVDNAILKKTSGNENKLITVTNHPLPRTTKQKSNDLDEYVIFCFRAFPKLSQQTFL